MNWHDWLNSVILSLWLYTIVDSIYKSRKRKHKPPECICDICNPQYKDIIP